jgi:hypothetical protein
MSFENANVELTMEPMMDSVVVVSEKKVSKSLTMNEKRTLYGILSFLVIANRDGLLDDAKTHELIEHLPIFQTVPDKKAYLAQDMFDVKKTEKDILKPLILEHNHKLKMEKKMEKKAAKKEQKLREAAEGGEKEKKEPKKRVSKKKVVVEQETVEEVQAVVEAVEQVQVQETVEEEKKEPKKRVSKKKAVVEQVQETVEEVPTVVEAVEAVEQVQETVEEEKKEPKKRVSKKKAVVEQETVEEVKETVEAVEDKKKESKKRGRKAKEQIVECNTEVNMNAGNSQEDQLADLVSQLTGNTLAPLLNPNEIELSDLDDVLSNLEEGEVEEKVARVKTPVLEEKKAPKKKAVKANK